MTKEYCWDYKNKCKYKVVGRDKQAGRTQIETLDGSIAVGLSDEQFNKRYKMFRPKSYRGHHKLITKCECGVEAAYGKVPPSWHTDYCPKGEK